MLKKLRKKGLNASEVMTYIELGRKKVLGHPVFDPYAAYKSPMDVRAAMIRHATMIACWFNCGMLAWDDKTLVEKYEAVVQIQRGPAHHLRACLQHCLSTRDFMAATSWAEREKLAPGSVNMDARPDLKQTLLKLYDECIGGRWLWPSDRQALTGWLVFTFYGPTKTGQVLGKSLLTDKILL